MMMIGGKKTALLLAITFCILLPRSGEILHAQSSHRFSNIHFYQLNTSHGLSDNYIQTLCTDRSGNLWIGTGDGLNMFNGKTVVKFFPREYPQLRNSSIRQIVCDNMNRMWIKSNADYVTIIDEHRQFHKVCFWRNGEEMKIRRLYLAQSKGAVLMTRDSFYVLLPGVDFTKTDTFGLDHFQGFVIPGFEELHKKNFNHTNLLDDRRASFSIKSGFYIIDFKTNTLSKLYEVPSTNIMADWNKDELLVFRSDISKVQVVNLVTGNLEFPFDSLRDQFGNLFEGFISNCERISPEVFLMTTQREGIYIYDRPTHTLFKHKHNAADPTTIVNDSPSWIVTDSTGWVFLGAVPHGISYFKSNAVIGQQTIFMDKQGTSYDGYVSNINTRDNDNFYIATYSDLLHWKRSTNTTEFMLKKIRDKLPVKEIAANYIEVDNRKRLWVSLPTYGMCVFDENDEFIKFFHVGKLNERGVLENYLHDIHQGPDGNIWVASRQGIFRIDPETFEVVRPPEQPFKDLEKTIVHRLWFEDDHNIWLATTRGAWNYNFTTCELIIHSTDNGLPSNNVLTMNKDRNGNLYIGTDNGLEIVLTNGKRKRITMDNGLLNSRVEALLLDRKNRMWIGNDCALECWTIADSTLKIFDERYGLSVQGFRVQSYHQNSDDELMWGTERGIQYFYPDDLYEQEIKLRTTIYRIETRDFVSDLTGSKTLSLSPGNNFITFYFSTIDFSTHLRTFYQYRLNGADDDWVNLSDQNFVRYNSLKAGNYTFQVRSSNDNKVWVEAENTITFEIKSHFWDRLWFRFLSLGVFFFAIYSVITHYNRKQKKRTEELETEAAINYFASRINTHLSTDDLLWDVVRNVISKLQFEDCVIYLLDPTRNVLVQKAAFGPKSATDYTIHQPMNIAIGEGIVGSVAKSAQAEIVNDTTLDPRYIVDDKRRYSELSVPILLEGKVFGVIDSEHSKKNFFTPRHLSILSTIAVLCVNQIQRIVAEEERQKAEIEILQNKQKATESRLQSLRLQMNPHFLFNALNSIQQMILANEEMVATRYLSRFSKLLRSILIHSDKEMISLKEELEILKLYVELESVRFKEAFSYEIDCDEDIDTDEVKIPTLLIQPFVENAIWHGLMHKEGMRNLKIAFTDKGDFVQCIIEDNGIGRQKAHEMKISTGQDKKHTSKGIQVSLERLKAIQKNGGMPGSMEIIDLMDDKGHPLGTRIKINLPIQN